MNKRFLAAAQAVLTAATLLCGITPVRAAAAEKEPEPVLVEQKLVMQPDGGPVQGEVVQKTRTRKSAPAKSASPESQITLQGVLPEGILGEAVNVDPDDYIEPTECDILCAYDISLYDQNVKYEPDENPVTVTVTADSLIKAEENGIPLVIVHIPDSPADPVEYITDYLLEEGTLTFTAESFSVYLIACDETGTHSIEAKPRQVYHYLTGDKDIYGLLTNTPYMFQTVDENGVVQGGDVSTQIVKDGDILRQPPFPPIHDDKVFLGWYLITAITGEEAASDATFGWPLPDQLERIEFGQPVSVTEDNVHYYLAPLYQEYRILVFHDNAANSDTDSILAKRMVVLGTTDDNHLSAVTDISSPTASDLNASLRFNGWRIGDDLYQIEAGTPCEITITAEDYPETFIHLYPDYVEAYWLTFDKNAGNATYVPPLLVKSNERVTNDKLAGRQPTRQRYTFTGWYTDPDNQTAETMFANANGELAGRFASDPSGYSLAGDMTVYAGWEYNEGEAPYKVVYWKQKTDLSNPDDQYAYFGEAFTENGVNVGYKEYSAMPGEWVSATEFPETPTGFHRRTDGPKRVSENGNTVINVYYDRDSRTINFYTHDSYTEVSPGNNSNTTYYGMVDGNYVELVNEYSYTPQYTYVDAAKTTDTHYYITNNGTYDSTYLFYNPNDDRFYTDYSRTRLFQNPVYDRINGGEDYTGTRYVRSGNRFVPTTSTSNNSTMYMLDDNGGYVPLSRSSNPVSYSYNGEPYTGTRYYKTTNSGQWYLYKSFSGLYGQTFDQVGVSWPAEYNWYNSYTSSWNSVNASGTRFTFLDAFLDDDNYDANGVFKLYAADATTSGNAIRFYKENLDGSWEEANLVFSSGGSFTLTNKYQGFHLYQYSKNGTTWYSAAVDQSISNYTNLYIRFARNTNDFYFMGEDGTPVSDLRDKNGNPVSNPVTIPYGGVISDYIQNAEDIEYTFSDPINHFEHWCADEATTQRFYFNSTMPDNDVTVYPKAEKTKFRIKINPNGGVLAPGDSTYFNVEYGDTVGEYEVSRTYIEDPDGTYYYVCVTYDEEHPVPERIAKYIPVSDTEQVETYSAYIDTSRKYRPMTEEDGTYEFVGWFENSEDGDPYNFEEEVTRPVTLVAKWRLVGARFRVAYIAVQDVTLKDGTIVHVSGSVEQEVDPVVPAGVENPNNYGYVDGTEAVVLGAPESITPGYVFEYWQDKNGNTYDPGEILTVNSNLATGFIIPLQAVYATAEESIHSQKRTHLLLHPNPPDGSAENDADVEQLRDLQVNELVDLSGHGSNWSYTGYELVGWSTEKQQPVWYWDDDDLPEGFFHLGDQVGADLNDLADPEEGYTNHLYAVWRHVLPVPTSYHDAAAPYIFLTVIVGAAFVLIMYNRRRKGGDVDETSPL